MDVKAIKVAKNLEPHYAEIILGMEPGEFYESGKFWSLHMWSLYHRRIVCRKQYYGKWRLTKFGAEVRKVLLKVGDGHS